MEHFAVALIIVFLRKKKTHFFLNLLIFCQPAYRIQTATSGTFTIFLKLEICNSELSYLHVKINCEVFFKMTAMFLKKFVFIYLFSKCNK